MFCKIRKVNNRREGQAVVEFALVLPVLILIIVGIIEFGLLMNNYLVVTYAAREGARSAALGGTLTTVTTTAKTAASTIDHGSLTVTMSPATPTAGSSVTVTVTNPVQFITPMIAAFFPSNPYPVSGQAVMRVE